MTWRESGFLLPADATAVSCTDLPRWQCARLSSLQHEQLQHLPHRCRSIGTPRRHYQPSSQNPVSDTRITICYSVPRSDLIVLKAAHPVCALHLMPSKAARLEGGAALLVSQQVLHVVPRRCTTAQRDVFHNSLHKINGSLLCKEVQIACQST